MGFLLAEDLFTEENTEKLIYFLRKEGWSEKPADFSHSRFFSKFLEAEDEIVKVILPSQFVKSNANLRQQTSDALKALAYFYDTQPEELWDRITNKKEDSDRIFFCWNKGEQVSSAPASLILGVLSNTLKLLDSAVDAVAQEGEARMPIIRSCRLGHSFHGSYGISLEIPMQFQIPIVDHELDIWKPVERRAVELTFQTLNILQEPNSAAQRLAGTLENYPDVCDALYNLVNSSDDGDKMLILDAEPSSIMPFKEGIVHKVNLTRSMLTFIHTAREQLEELQRGSGEYYRTKGMVTALSIQKGESLTKATRLDFKITDENLKRKITVRNVSMDFYMSAMQAQREEKMIEVAGLVDFSKKQLSMNDAHLINEEK